MDGMDGMDGIDFLYSYYFIFLYQFYKSLKYKIIQNNIAPVYRQIKTDNNVLQRRVKRKNVSTCIYYNCNIIRIKCAAF